MRMPAHFWRDIFTGRGNQSFDFLRVVGVLAGAIGMFNAVWSTVVNGHPFDSSGYFMGLAAWGAGMGIGVRVARPLDDPGLPPPDPYPQPMEGEPPHVGDSFR